MEDVKDNIVEYLSRRKFLTLATSNKKGEPLTHPIAYVNIGPVVYFSTNKNSRKVKNIMENTNVAYSIYDATEYLDEVRSVQMEGDASIVESEKESLEILRLLNKKFPTVEYMKPSGDSIYLKVTPKTCHFSDYIKRFGDREIVEF
jgi:nitroimidazol reductase NimA-like FMN-containing flavoprotein (pyridoxamine 5'-phosphate oxidase superfamily)